MIRPFWKIVSLLVSLAAFMIVGVLAVNIGDELIWIVGKAVGAFIICWIVLSQMGLILFALAEQHEDTKNLNDGAGGSAVGNKRG